MATCCRSAFRPGASAPTKTWRDLRSFSRRVPATMWWATPLRSMAAWFTRAQGSRSQDDTFSAVRRQAAARQNAIAQIQLADVAARPGQRFRVHDAEPQRRDRRKPEHAGVAVRQARDIVEIAQRLIGPHRVGVMVRVT